MLGRLDPAFFQSFNFSSEISSGLVSIVISGFGEVLNVGYIFPINAA